MLRDSFLTMYHKLKESGASPSDFPNILANIQYKKMIEAVRSFGSPFRRYAWVTEVNDFKTNDRPFMGAAEDLDAIPVGGPYKATNFKDYKYSVQLGTFGKTFAIHRQTIINDDQNAFERTPKQMGIAATRTLVKQLCALLESNANAYDGSPMFTTRNGVANQSSDALTADVNGIAALQAGFLAIATAKDPSGREIMGLRPRYLLVSPQRAENAKWLVSALQLSRGATDGPNSNPLRDAALAGPIEVLVEPWLTAFPNRWYLLCDPNDVPALEVAFLRGGQEPALLVKNEDTRMISGGNDPYGYDYDDISYKIRWDWSVAVAMPQAIFKGGS